MTTLSDFDRQFCRYVSQRAKGNVNHAFTLLVTALACGHSKYVRELCKTLGHPKDLLKTAAEVLKIGEL